jgi:hypothetical protein
MRVPFIKSGSVSKAWRKKFQLTALLAPLTIASAYAGQPAVVNSSVQPIVWYAPNNDTPDFLDLFRVPEAWPNTRSLINILKFGPRQLSSGRSSRPNSLAELMDADAFRKLKTWGISVAVEAPSVKEWDCTSERAARITLEYIENVHSAGNDVRYVAMDEPLVSGLRSCKLSIDETAERTASYLSDVAMKSAAISKGIVFGDIEPYPSFTVDQLKRWFQVLRARGATIGFFHLDVDLNDVARRPSVDLISDLRDLKAFFAKEKIPLGIIVWSGRDPENSDESYYNHVIDYVKVVRKAIGTPEQLVFQSWVFRVSKTCGLGLACSATNTHCGPFDPPYCGSRSVPINLPDDSSKVFSHTRLIRESLSILTAPRDR